METLSEFDSQFGTDDQCRAFLAKMRWRDGVRCPRCGSDKPFALKARPYHWVCKSGKETVDKQTGEVAVCHKRNGYRFSVITRTIFQDTKIPLNLWFKVGYLMLTAKKGISALQIHRVMFGEDSGHDYHTSWFMCMRWRAAMAGDMYQPLKGIVEADETYVGGKDRNRHWNKKSAQRRAAIGELPIGKRYGYGKVGVIGAIERKGNVVARVIGSQDAPTLAGFVRNVVSDKVSLVATDDNQDYGYIDRNIRHESVKHSAGEYVRGEVHTNSIESFWSLLKRGVVGSYHNVSKKYLPFYLNEFSFRFNNRKNPAMFADLITTCAQ
ncbi:MAG TPA: IS1595 family transposase [Candidatus Binataceae bacterium]|nr:IS1595 family transposase [Candidatus Binataceae bacterium]